VTEEHTKYINLDFSEDAGNFSLLIDLYSACSSKIHRAFSLHLVMTKIQFFILHSSLISFHRPPKLASLCLNLRLKDILKSHSISSKLADALPQLLNCHLVLVEIEAEVGFLVNVCLLLDIERLGL